MKPARAGRGGGRGRLPDWNDLALPLPEKTAERIVAVGRRPTDADNVGLWLDKLVHRNHSDWTLTGEHRSFSLRQLCRPWQSTAGEAARARMAETVAVVHPHAEQRRRLRAKINGRLLMDHGRAAATETSVSLHPVWGVPRIAGSALKGVTRAETYAGEALASAVLDPFVRAPDPAQRRADPHRRAPALTRTRPALRAAAGRRRRRGARPVPG